MSETRWVFRARCSRTAWCSYAGRREAAPVRGCMGLGIAVQTMAGQADLCAASSPCRCAAVLQWVVVVFLAVR